MNTDISKQIMERFYCAVDTIVANGTIKGISTYCNSYNIDRRNFYANRKDLDRGWFQVSWLEPLVRCYGISANWLITGTGRMFVN